MEVTKQNNYEIMYIVDDEKPELAAKLKKEFVEILTDNQGQVKKEEDFVRQFAYKINHKVKGHYFVLEVLTTAENIAKFNRVFLIKQKQGEVIRKLVINLDQEKYNTFKKVPEKPAFTNTYNNEYRPRHKTENVANNNDAVKAKAEKPANENGNSVVTE